MCKITTTPTQYRICVLAVHGDGLFLESQWILSTSSKILCRAQFWPITRLYAVLSVTKLNHCHWLFFKTSFLGMHFQQRRVWGPIPVYLFFMSNTTGRVLGGRAGERSLLTRGSGYLHSRSLEGCRVTLCSFSPTWTSSMFSIWGKHISFSTLYVLYIHNVKMPFEPCSSQQMSPTTARTLRIKLNLLI